VWSELSFRYSIVILVIGLMAFLFQRLFGWQKRVENAGYFASIYQDTISKIELRRLGEEVEQNWARGEYLNEIYLGRSPRGRTWVSDDPKPEPGAPLIELARQLEREWELHFVRQRLNAPQFGDTVGLNRRPGGAPPPGMSMPAQSASGVGGLGGSGTSAPAEGRQNLQHDYSNARDEFLERVSGWEQRAAARAWEWYQEDLLEQQAAAKVQAERALQVDFSALRGRGPEFVLEFTAIVVIIFAAVILGVLDILKEQQIGTLLAAIAGYVLGKSVARSRSDQAVPNQLEVRVKREENDRSKLGESSSPHPPH
jgi:hypothetical protein